MHYIVFMNNIIVFFLYLITSIPQISLFQHKVINITLTDDKPVYSVDNTYCIPLIYLTRVTFILFGYILLHYTTMLLFGKFNLLSYWISDLLKIFNFTIYSTLILISCYWYMENFTKISDIWGNFKHEESARRMVYVLTLFNVFVYYLLYVVFKTNSMRHIIPTIRSKTSTFTIFVGLLIVSCLNYMTDDEPNKQYEKTIGYKIAYTIAFLFTLLLG
jgi:hypothetical protein